MNPTLPWVCPHPADDGVEQLFVPARLGQELLLEALQRWRARGPGGNLWFASFLSNPPEMTRPWCCTRGNRRGQAPCLGSPRAFRKFGGQRTSSARTSRPPRASGSSAWLRKWCLLASCITAEEEAANNEFCWSSSESSVSSCFLTQFLPRFNLFSRIRWTSVDFTLILLCSVWKTRCKPQTSLEFHFVLFFSLYDRTTSACPWFIYYYLLASWKLAVCCSCPVYRNNSSSDPCK